MSTTLKIGIPGGLLVSQLEKKLKLLFSYRNIWKHKIRFINARNYHSSTNVCTIPSIFWIWISKISIASGNKKLTFWYKYLAFFTKFLALKPKMLKIGTLQLTERQVIHLWYQFLTYYSRLWPWNLYLGNNCVEMCWHDTLIFTFWTNFHL